MRRATTAVLAIMLLLVPAGVAAQARETRDVCLEVTALDSLTTAQVAAHVMGGTADVVGPGEKCRDEPLPVIAVPRDDLVDVREASWYRIEFQPDGRTLDVYYVNGVEDCFGLDRVEVAATESGLDVRVFTGDIPEVEFCNLPNVLYVTTLELDEPMITGSRGDD